MPSDGGSGHGNIPHTFEIPVCSGDSVTFQWTTGSYDSECSYTILNGNDETIHTGSGAMQTVSAMPVCPTCIKVLNLSASGQTNEGATISWVGNETAQGYLVYLTGELTSDSPVADTYITNSPDKYELAYLDQENVEQFGVAMAKTDEALQTAINEAMKQLKDEGFFEENTAKWFA